MQEVHLLEVSLIDCDHSSELSIRIKSALFEKIKTNQVVFGLERRETQADTTQRLL
jgi:hypothetical protein